jgi:anti-sigma factor RsiW
MICFTNRKEGAEILLDYTSGTLDPVRSAELDRHMEACAECRRLVESQRTVYSALDQFTAPEVSADFDKKLYARIAADKPSFWQRFLPAAPLAWTPMTWWKPAVPLALAALALCTVLVLRTEHPGSAQKQPGIGQADIEHVEQALDDLDLLAPAAASSSSPVL